MTKIVYAKDWDAFSLVCKGHAGFAEAGSDIVCAGISTLVQTLTHHLSNEQHVKYHIEPGGLWIWARGDKALICFEVILTGLKLLESQYPDYIEITEGCPIVLENPL